MAYGYRCYFTDCVIIIIDVVVIIFFWLLSFVPAISPNITFVLFISLKFVLFDF